MEPIVLWQQKWGLTFHIPWYLFLGGLAGSTLAIGALADLLGRGRGQLASFSRIAAYVTVPAILIGGLSLSFHLGKPERGFAFPLFFTNYQSWLTLGGWVIGAFAPLSIAYAAAWFFGLGRGVRLLLAVFSVPLGILMSLYTGFLLSAAWLVPGDRWYVALWDRNYLPVLFLLSGFSTGLAACGLTSLIAAHIGRPREGDKRPAETASLVEATSLVDAVAILAEGAWVYLFLAFLAAGTLGQQFAYRLLTQGDLATWFWWGFVATGLAVPLVVSVLHLISERLLHLRVGWLLYAKFVLVLAGGLLLRYVVVWGGDMKMPLPFPPSLWPIPGAGGPPPGVFGG